MGLRVWFGSAFLFICFLQGIGVGAESSEQLPQIKKAPAKQQQNKANKKQPETSKPQPTEVFLTSPVTIVEQPKPDQKERDAEQKAQTKFNNWVQSVTLLFAALAAYGAIGAYLANRRQAKAAEQSLAHVQAEAIEQRQISLNALAETRKSAEAAQRSADIADQSLRVSERAWLFVKFDKLFRLNDEFVEFSIVNSGKTSGHVKEAKVIGFEPSDAPIPWTPGPIPKSEMDTQWSMPPGESLGQRWDFSIPIEEMVGAKRLTIFGLIVYDDVFGERHRTTFYRVFSATISDYEGVFIIPPIPETVPGQNENT